LHRFGQRPKGQIHDEIDSCARAVVFRSDAMRPKYVAYPPDSGLSREARNIMVPKIKWYVIEEVTVSSDGGECPEYRVSSEREMGPLPPAWVAENPGFATRDDAVKEMSRLRKAASPV
jgi:hypothetical protein